MSNSLSITEILLPHTLFCSFAILVASQQVYAPSSCTNATSASGYLCNGIKKRCQTYATFLAQPPYNTASSIATLLGSDPTQIAQINNISDSAVLVTMQEVIVPINCACSGCYYQSNTSYVVREGDTYSLIANSTFEGLTTYQAIQDQNDGFADTYSNGTLTIPLRCACPTKNQIDRGIKYLLTYVIRPGDAIALISLQFDADLVEISQANEFNGDYTVTIQPFTTILIPLRNPPNGSMIILPPPPSASQPPSPPLMHRYDSVFLCID